MYMLLLVISNSLLNCMCKIMTLVILAVGFNRIHLSLSTWLKSCH